MKRVRHLSEIIREADRGEPLNWRCKGFTPEQLCDEILCAVSYLSHRGALPTRLQHGLAMALEVVVGTAVSRCAVPEEMIVLRGALGCYLAQAQKWENPV